MTKLSRTLALTGMLAVAASALSVAPAQDAKPKKTAKKGGIVQINESPKNHKFYMSIRDAEGKFLAQGGPGGYETKEDALKALEAIKAAVESPKIEYNTKKDDDKDDDEKKDKKKESKKKDDEKAEPKKKGEKG